MKKTITAAFCLALFITPAFAKPIYTVQLMDTPSNQVSYAYDLNEKGQIAGATRDENGYEHAAYWDADGTRHLLGTNGLVRGINNQGNMAGWEFVDFPSGGSTINAPFWDKNTGKTTIPIENCLTCFATGINDANQVVGQVYYPNGSATHFIWDSVNGVTLLPTPENGELFSRPTINNNGQVTGFYRESGVKKPYLWDPDTGFTVIDLEAYNGYNMGLNDNGVIAGSYRQNSSPIYNPYIWDAVNGITHLSLKGSFNGGQAMDINNRNGIVGILEFYDPDVDSFFPSHSSAAYWHNDEIFELDDLIDMNDPLFGGIHLSHTSGINDKGQVVARGINYQTGQLGLFLLTPKSLQTISEPLPLSVIGMGLLGIFWRRKYQS